MRGNPVSDNSTNPTRSTGPVIPDERDAEALICGWLSSSSNPAVVAELTAALTVYQVDDPLPASWAQWWLEQQAATR
jgi:hypothetical protein